MLLCCLCTLLVLTGCESEAEKEKRERAEQVAQYRNNKMAIYQAENEQYATDGCHFTEEGYDVITSLSTPVLEEQLKLWHQEHP